MPGQFENLRFDAPFVVDHGAVRSLHFTLGEVQSSMRIDRPDDLLIDYTRTMMGFLLLQPDPRDILMIGLGGGSLAKFCYRHLPRARITVVENNPGVIALRREFAIPDDDSRLRVVAGDGAKFVQGLTGTVDVLLVDGFDHQGQPAGLSSPAFFDHCHRALDPGGVLAVNLHADDANHVTVRRRICSSFRGNAMQVPAREKSNCVVLAARGRPVTLQALRGANWAGALAPQAQRQLRDEIAQIGWNASDACCGTAISC